MNRRSRLVRKGIWITAGLVLMLTCGIHVGCSRYIESLHDQNMAQDLQELVARVDSVPPAGHEPLISPDLSLRLADTLLGEIADPDSVLDVDDSLVVGDPCGEDAGMIDDATGGTLAINCTDGLSEMLIVQPNALTKDTTLWMRSYDMKLVGLDLREYHFGPSGINFNTAATLQLSAGFFREANGQTATEIAWLYYNPDTKRWELQNIIPIAVDGYFYIPVNHFSVYRAATRSSVGLSQGGQQQHHTN